MILIADSGSTKTDWALVQNGKTIKLLQTKGINPFFLSSDEIFHIVYQAFSSEIDTTEIDQIFFYGAGCIKGLNSEIIESGLIRFFKNSIIHAQDDMIGAARSLFGNEAGIACILGTGANTCKYDGSVIVEKIPSLGFILGDEGSGAYLGKTLINNYFKNIMPPDLAKEFTQEYHPTEKDVLNQVYRQASPNHYLANYSRFLKKHIDHIYVQKLLKDSFQAFVSNNIAKYSHYQDCTVGFVGSIAHHFSGFMMLVAKKNKITIGKFIEKPIDGLIQFHLSDSK